MKGMVSSARWILGWIAILGALPIASLAADQATEPELTRRSSAGGVGVAVVFVSPLEGGGLADQEQLRFRISIDAHAGDLMRYDLTRMTALRTDEGEVAAESGFIWEPESESSHHRVGVLRIPNRLAGRPIAGQGAAWVELEIRGLVTPARVFRWELPRPRP